MLRRALSVKAFGSLLIVNGCITSDLSFNQRAINPADAGGFTGTKDIGHTGGLERVNLDKSICQFTPKSQRQFDIGHQAKATCQQIAFFRPGLSTVRKCHLLDLLGSLGASRPSSEAIGHAPQSELQQQALPQLPWVAQESCAEASDAGPACLLDDGP